MAIAQEAQEKADEEERLRKEWEANGGQLPEKEEKKVPFDSNCITPGTPFMSNLAQALKYYIKVILSDASVPGEGEHKIMDYIRRQRSQPEYDPNCSHVLYGLDADLIMLALSTHEPYFKILREDVFFKQNDNRGCFICGQLGHQASECTGKKKERNGEFDEKGEYVEKPYVFLHVNILREYLEAELKENDLPFPWDLERAIDDWIFLCFFVGNDFLPHLPSLEIREGAIDRLIEIWRRNLRKFGGYITTSGEIDLHRVQILLSELGQVEDDIFIKRRHEEERKRESRRRRKQEMKNREQDERAPKRGRFDHRSLESHDQMSAIPSWTPKEKAEANKKIIKEKEQASVEMNKAAAQMLKASLKKKREDPTDPAPAETQQALKGVQEEKASKDEANGGSLDPELPNDAMVVEDADIEEEDIEDEIIEETLTVADVPIPKKTDPVDSDAEPEDDVRLWSPGWKKRIVTKYVEGFCWVLKYYYQGVQSWKWFFPYHYSPFASDFYFISELNIQFELGEPFKPFEQLMGVLPAASRAHIPKVFHSLMTEESSPIIDFYPEKFPIDLNGKKYAWQGVALLPFIEENRLLEAMLPLYKHLSEDETLRNSKGDELLFIGGHHRLFESLCGLYTKKASDKVFLSHFTALTLKRARLDPVASGRMMGITLPDPNVSLPGLRFESPFAHLNLSDVEQNQSISAIYKMPEYPSGFSFKAELLPHVSLPRNELSADDVYWVRLGGKPSRGRGRGNRDTATATRFIRHATGMYNTGPGADNLPYMGGGGYNNYSQPLQSSYSSYQATSSQGWSDMSRQTSDRSQRDDSSRYQRSYQGQGSGSSAYGYDQRSGSQWSGYGYRDNNQVWQIG
ncbi:5'-3' exoribonuclease 2 [Phlyctochytrium bullatum]|nr:5'-3' exoribonuclease 2 [Phlyctochytrium bullatum]